MKSKLIIYLVLVTMIACNGGKSTQHHHDEHVLHGPEGMVILTKRQIDALGLQLGTIQQRNLTTLVKTTGELEVPPSAEAFVSAVIGGNVKSINVLPGDKVSKGQVLAVLEHPDYISLQEDFIEVAGQLNFLEQEYRRQKELYEKNVASGKDFQKVETDYKILKARFEGLKARLQLLNLSPEAVINGIISPTVTVISPLNGYVNKINVRLGTYVNASDVLFCVTDNSHLHADFHVYEKDIHLLKEGQKVTFSVAGNPKEEYTATIFAIGKELDAETRFIHVHAHIDNHFHSLLPGMFISGSIQTDTIFTDCLPNDAVVKDGTKAYIFVLDESVNTKSLLEHDHHEDEHTDEATTEHEDEPLYALRMVEVVVGKVSGGFTEIKPMEKLPEDSKVALNNAYYLLADLKKEETSHEH